MIKKCSIIILILTSLQIKSNCQDKIIRVSNYDEFVEQATFLKKELMHQIESDSSKEIESIIDTKFIINEYERDKTLIWLSNAEKTLIYFCQKKYDKILSDIEGNSHYFNDSYLIMNHYFYNIPSIQTSLKEFWLKTSNDILTSINESTISSIKKELLTIYWKNIINNIAGFPKEFVYNQDTLNQEATKLIERSDEYKWFVKRHFRYIYKKSNWGLGADISPFGYASFTNDLSDYFINGFAGGVNIDISNKKWLYNIKLYGFNADISKSITYKSDWNTTGRIFSYNAGLNIGYSILDNNRLRITPAGGSAIGGIKYIEGDSTIEKTDVLIQPNLAMIVDLKFNVPIKRYREKYKSSYGIDKEVAYWYFRFYGGCHPLGFNNKFKQNGSIWYFNIGLGGYFSPSIRVIE